MGDRASHEILQGSTQSRAVELSRRGSHSQGVLVMPCWLLPQPNASLPRGYQVAPMDNIGHSLGQHLVRRNGFQMLYDWVSIPVQAGVGAPV